MKRLTFLVGLFAACGGGSDADFNGDYTLSISNRQNDCDLPAYTVGGTSMTALVIAQTDGVVTGTVGVGGAGYLDLVIGAHVFMGSVDGDSVDMNIIGTRPQTRGNCTFTYDARFKASLDGDAINGRVEYTAKTNNNTDCSLFNDCVTLQELAGSRPPM